MSQEELNTDYVGEDVEAVGWGKTENEDTSDIKLRVNVRDLRLKFCYLIMINYLIINNLIIYFFAFKCCFTYHGIIFQRTTSVVK